MDRNERQMYDLEVQREHAIEQSWGYNDPDTDFPEVELEDVVSMKEESDEYKRFIALFAKHPKRPIILDRTMLLQENMLLEEYKRGVDFLDIEPMEQYSRKMDNFGDFSNQILTVHGMCIWEVDYTPKSQENADSKQHARYFQIRILAVDSEGKIRLIKSSGKDLMRHVFFACQKYGWFIFEKPIKYRFSWEGTGKPHVISNLDTKLGS